MWAQEVPNHIYLQIEWYHSTNHNFNFITTHEHVLHIIANGIIIADT
jgi:hypothetical protein